MKSIRLMVFSATTIGTCAIGCAVEQKVKKDFDPPRLPNVPPVVDSAIDAPLQQKAGEQIALALSANDPVLRAQAFEAMSRTRDARAGDFVMRGLADRDSIVRFAACLCAGDLKLSGAYRSLGRAALDDDASVRVASRYALHRLGDYSMSKELEALSEHENPRVRAHVALVIGLLKEPTGVAVVRPLMRDGDDRVRLAAAEALWQLGDPVGRENLVAGTISKFVDEQIVCTLALAQPRDANVKPFILGKLAIDKDNRQYVELQLAAARALGMLGDDSGFGVATAAARSNEPRQRMMAAFALGAIGRTDAQSALAKLLGDAKPEVRLAAATALRQLATPTGATASAG